MEIGGLKTRFAAVAAKEVVPIPLEEAVRVFEWMADMEEMAFGYLEEGCCARAHMMCQKMMDLGMGPKKAWAVESSKKLNVHPLMEQGMNFWYHVAPVLAVEMPDGTVQDLVFDPSLFNGPVTMQQWGSALRATPENLQIKPLGVAPEGKYKDGKSYGDYGGSVNTYDDAGEESEDIIQRIMEKVSEDRNPQKYTSRQRMPRDVLQSQVLQKIFQGKAFKSRTRGSTYRTLDTATPALPAAAPALTLRT